jgi:hypothetical protein
MGKIEARAQLGFDAKKSLEQIVASVNSDAGGSCCFN